MKKTLLLSLVTIILLGGFTKPTPPPDDTIKWYTFEEAFELNKKNPKKIFIDVYTDWCGWCKKMDANTFKNKDIARIMNKYFYAVKLDAEMKTPVKMDTVTFVNRDPTNKKSTHDLANALLNGQMSYPSTVYLDEKFAMLSAAVPGYQTPESIEPILIFLGENHFTNTKWEDFTKTFKSTLQK